MRWGRRFVGVVLAALSVVASLSAGVASAHQPVFVDRTDRTDATGPLLLDGTVSFAIYGTLDGAGDERWVRARLRKGDPLLVELLVPDLEPERSAGALGPIAEVRAPNGTWSRVKVATRRVFTEPFSGTRYVYVASTRGVAVAGTYAIRVTGRTAGRFTLVVGTRETRGEVQGASASAPGALAAWWAGTAATTTVP